MLRITIQRADDDLVMKLEGCLAGPWVHELDACWRQARAQQGGRVRVDLRGVCHVDEAGRELMGRMHHAGAAFVVLPAVVVVWLLIVPKRPVADPSLQET